MAVNKSDLVRALADAGVVDPGKALNRALDVIVLAVALGESVSIRNFGKFEPRVHPATIKTDPRNGEPLPVPERRTVVFLPSVALKARLNR